MDNIETHKKIFSERLRKLRNEKEIKQEYLAEKLSISRTKMSRMENISSFPSLEILIHLSKIFDVSIDYLVGLSDDRKISKQKTKTTTKTTTDRNNNDIVPEEPYTLITKMKI